MVATIVLASVAAVATPLSAGASNASSAAVATPSTARTGNASTAAVVTPHTVGVGGWHTETVDSVGSGWYTSLQLTPTGWPAISFYTNPTNYDLKYTYKDASGWHNQVVDNGGGYGTSLQLTPSGWPAISYWDVTNGDLKYAYKSAA